MSRTALTLQNKQHEVQMKLGGIVLRVQQYELLLRQLLEFSDIAVVASKSAASGFTRPNGQKVAKLSLGNLIGRLERFVLRTTDFPPDESLPADVLGFRTRFALQVTPETLTTIKKNLRAMVATRNKIVHRLSALHDLTTEAGCDNAIYLLDSARAGVDREFEELQRINEVRAASNQHLIDLLRSPEFKRLLDTAEL